MTTRDTETIYRIFGLEHEGDIALFPTPEPKRKPVRPRLDVIRFGRTLPPPHPIRLPHVMGR
jgi:hypothetical protein